MGWSSGVVVILALQYIVEVASAPHSPTEFEINDHDILPDTIEETPRDFLPASEDYKLEQLGRVLANVLMQPWPKGISPILYVEEYPTEETIPLVEEEHVYEEPIVNNVPFKRSRYYRKYPWKRQNSRPRFRLAPYPAYGSSGLKSPLVSGGIKKTSELEVEPTGLNDIYDAENRYLCQPSKEDVFRLLVALHEARQGNRGQTVNFCNRKRPATAVFTNIRFLG